MCGTLADSDPTVQVIAEKLWLVDHPGANPDELWDQVDQIKNHYLDYADAVKNLKEEVPTTN